MSARGKKNIISYKFHNPTLDSLIGLKELASSKVLNDFEKKYGWILSFVHNIDDHEAKGLNTLMQFYDPLLRCFVLPDFLLVPTLEEYASLLNIPIKECIPFCGTKDGLDFGEMAGSLYLGKLELESNISFKGKLHGYKLEYLTKKAQEAAREEKWLVFNALLALCVYGIVLFPNEPKFVDSDAIRIFMTKNPVPTLLRDLHYAMYNRNEKKRGGMVHCCAPLFYKWFAGRMPQSGAFVDSKKSSEWSKRLMGLEAKDIMWINHGLLGKDIIHSCGNYPNVPLIGRKGGINYNPSLAVRQFGYALTGPPSEEDIKHSLYCHLPDEIALAQKAAASWAIREKKGKKVLGKSNNMAYPAYEEWIRKRVKDFYLPFDPVCPEAVKDETTIPLEEFNKLKDQVKALQIENSELRGRLYDVVYATKEMEYKTKEALKTLEDTEKELVERTQHFHKIILGADATTETLKRTKNELAQTKGKLTKFQQAWDEVRIENSELQDQSLSKEVELKKAHEYRRKHQDDLQETEDELQMSKKELEEAMKEMQKLRLQAGVKRHKRISDDEALLRHMDTLTEALKKRDDLIREMIEKPNHQRTHILFGEIKCSSESLKDLEMSD